MDSGDEGFNLLWRAAFSDMAEQVERGASRRAKQIVEKLRKRPFQLQLDFIEDPCRHKVLLCPRRSGKSYAIAIYMLLVCLRTPYANCVYVARTRDKAREIMWELLKKLNQEFEIGIRFSEVHTAAWLPNGSRFRLRGCETTADIEQFRGEPFHVVFVDEAATLPAGVIDPLLDQAIEPTLGDYLGTLVLCGTPGAVLDGRFYKTSGDPAFEIADNYATSRPYRLKNTDHWDGVDFGWSYHSWTRRDNKILPHLWEEALRIKKLNGWGDQHPVWLREYVGRWIATDTNLVYSYNPERNTWKPGKRTNANPFGLEPGHDWKYVLGMDFGHKDPFAMQIVAYSETHPHMFQCWEFQKRGLTPPGFAEQIKKACSMCEIEWMIGDFGPYAEMLQLQLAQEYELPIEKAEKKEKRDYIDLLNGDFDDGRCFLMEGSETGRQMLVLSWDETKIKEKSGMRNDLCDALVYTWRRVQHHYSIAAAPPPPEYGTPEWENQRDAEEVELEIERMRQDELAAEQPWGDNWR